MQISTDLLQHQYLICLLELMCHQQNLSKRPLMQLQRRGNEMNFSEAFQQTKHLVQFSPDGSYVASCSQYRLVIRDTRSLQILNLHTCLDPVQYVEWSPDSLFVMCGMFKRGFVQVWSIEQPEWTCKIDEGSAGLVACCWTPDSRHILTTSDFQLRMTLWSLVNKSISYIKYPKLTHMQDGLDFTGDGKYMALAERRDCRDFVSIFDCSQWQLVKNFPVETKDLAGLSWSPDGKVLCVWDSCLDYKVLLYSMDGRSVASYSAYEHALGVKCVRWSPSSQFLAIGSYDQKIRVLNHVTWKTVAAHSHPATVDFSSVVVYTEVERKPQNLKGGEPSFLVTKNTFPHQSKYETSEIPVTVPTLKPDPEKPNPKLGVGTVVFSPDCKYMATKNDNMPNAVWIWDVAKLRLAVLLLQSSPVREIQWDPLQPRLALCTGNGKLYLWSPAGCVSVAVPMESTAFTVQRLLWHPSANALALLGGTHFCMCYLNE